MSETLVIPSTCAATVFDRTLAPAATVAPGAVVRFETGDDAFARLAAGETVEQIGVERLNVVTGPLHVDGARSGDALRVEVLQIEVRSAWSAWLPGFGHLGAHTDEPRIRRLGLVDGRIEIGDGLTVPVAPMIGCIGAAPAEGTASTVRPLYRLGGNMDLLELRAGTTVLLPVEVEGGLLSLGDLHAAMGQGEGAFVAIEAAGAATVRVGIEPGVSLALPRLRRDADRETICVGIGPTHAEATRSAIEQAYGLLVDGFGLAPGTAYAYVCSTVGLRFAGPAGSLIEGGLQGALAVVPDPR